MSARDFVFPNMIDPVQGVIFPNSEGIADESFLSPDFSTGILINYDKYFLGFSASHLPHTIAEKHGDYLLVTSVIDNLLKGASGQAVENMNLVFGMSQAEGLKLKASIF